MNSETSVSGTITRRANAPSGTITVKRSDPNYIRQYYHARKAQNPEYYSIYSLKKYYRKQLSLIDSSAASLEATGSAWRAGIAGERSSSDVNDNNAARKAKILSKLESLDAKLKSIKESREKYSRWKQPQKTKLDDASSSAV